jgi:hypothetical protein
MAYQFADVEGLACPPDVEGEAWYQKSLRRNRAYFVPEKTLAQRTPFRLVSLRPQPDLHQAVHLGG